MTSTVYLLLYGAMVTWLAPAPLSRLTRRGTNPRLGVAAWVTAMAGVLVAWTVAVGVVAVSLVRGGPNSSVVVLCLELLGVPEREAMLGAFAATGLLAVGVLVSAVVAVGVGRTVLGLRAHSAEHADAARIIGTPTDAEGVFVVAGERPAAYCVVGRPDTIVVTMAAVRALDGPELDAVLAHEGAHIAGRHHHLLMVLRALAASLAHLPLFTRGAAVVAELLEMCADDTAARRHGSRPLVAGMLALASPLPPSGGLAMAATATAARARRLLDPAGRSTRWCHRVATSATIAATIGAPVVVNVLCHH
ncbi:M56 family metallopeptidase [Mycobacterium sp. AT1]|uniref:M56 family metallopeptidase n=1 Tax=Mycobacterium sp. AT1 TaxID=1961706 RepID=UPI0009AC2264|nr:M56 family metallopeptidase [Mycobacterium sp. AT1]OPX08175.1 peptidase M48, Ste24p [Mycobacterium sp. AT1]